MCKANWPWDGSSVALQGWRATFPGDRSQNHKVLTFGSNETLTRLLWDRAQPHLTSCCHEVFSACSWSDALRRLLCHLPSWYLFLQVNLSLLQISSKCRNPQVISLCPCISEEACLSITFLPCVLIIKNPFRSAFLLPRHHLALRSPNPLMSVGPMLLSHFADDKSDLGGVNGLPQVSTTSWQTPNSTNNSCLLSVICVCTL